MVVYMGTIVNQTMYVVDKNTTILANNAMVINICIIRIPIITVAVIAIVIVIVIYVVVILDMF